MNLSQGMAYAHYNNRNLPDSVVFLYGNRLTMHYTADGRRMSTPSVVEALRTKKIRAAAIETWENEPHVNTSLLQAAWISTPHIAGYSADGKANATRMSLEAVAAHFGLDASFKVSPPPLPEGFIYDTETVPSCEALRRYDPRCDSRRLKAAPEQFEALRGNYPLRREQD